MTNKFKSRLAIVSATILFFLSHSASSRAQEKRTLRSPAVISNSKAVGRLPASTRIGLAIGFPLRNREALARLLQDIYNPGSTNYHNYLTVKQFTDRFGPTEQDYQTVRHWAQTNGFAIRATHPNRLLLDVNASVADIEKTFHTTMRVYQHPTEPRTFFAPDADPSVDSNLPILEIGGFNNFSAPHPVSDHTQFARSGLGAQPLGGTGSSPQGYYAGNDFRAAYAPDVTNTGTGQTVALVEFDSYYTNDILAYEVSNGLPNVAITNIYVDGATATPSSTLGNVIEVSGDIEMVISMAPGASIIVYHAPGYEEYYECVWAADDLNRIATDNIAKQISCSWAWDIWEAEVYTPVPSFTGYTSMVDQIFQEFGAQGQSFFQASGDGGGWNAGVNILAQGGQEPEDNPNITLVGGTSLTTTGPEGSYISETVWNANNDPTPTTAASGGGVSVTYPIPAWQQGLSMAANQGSTTMRNTPDVAMVADNILVMAGNGGSYDGGGTSFATPLWAAFTALVNQQAATNGNPPIGFVNPAIYAIGKGSGYGSSFHDITNGSSTNVFVFRGQKVGSYSQFLAAPGYDLCTGWGTPAGQSLINGLLAPLDPLMVTPDNSFTASGPVGGPFNVTSQSYFLTNIGSSILNWSLVNTSIWMSASSLGGTLVPSGPAAATTLSLNSAASSMPAGVYKSTVWVTNSTSGAAQNLGFTLEVGQPLVKNGGFETGDFAYWLGSQDFYNGELGGGGLDTGLVITNEIYFQVAHSGSYGAFLYWGQGLPFAEFFLSQTISTLPGQTYLVSFWTTNISSPSGSPLSVLWNGTSIFDQDDQAPGWTNIQLVVSAADTSTVLQFSLGLGAEIGLDDVSVVPLSPPAFQTVARTNTQVVFNWTAFIGMTYQLQYTTNLASTNWTSLGAPARATNSSASAFDSVGPDPQRFYRVVLLP